MKNGDLSTVGDPNLPEQSFAPIGILVVLKMVPVDKSPGGVVLPDTVKELGADRVGLEPARGWVVSAGCQCRYVRRGDLVLIQGQIVHFRHGGERLALVQETQLIGVERDEAGGQPEFDVADWKDGIIGRDGLVRSFEPEDDEDEGEL